MSEENFIRSSLQNFETDRQTNNKSYIHYLTELLKDELNDFCNEAKVNCIMTDCWSVRYKKGDQQIVHNHRSWGFSGILYVDYDPRVHTPTCFVSPWQDPVNDTTTLRYPPDIKEGTLLIFPSYTLHFVDPNVSSIPRTIISFDLLPSIPKHQSVT